jgi:hypothetical protein
MIGVPVPRAAVVAAINFIAMATLNVETVPIELCHIHR